MSHLRRIPLGGFYTVVYLWSFAMWGGARLVSFVWFSRIPVDPTPPRLCPARLPNRAPVERFTFRSRATWG